MFLGIHEEFIRKRDDLVASEESIVEESGTSILLEEELVKGRSEIQHYVG